MTIAEIMDMAPVIPVLVLDGAHDPVELAATLVEAAEALLPVLAMVASMTILSPALAFCAEALMALTERSGRGAIVGVWVGAMVAVGVGATVAVGVGAGPLLPRISRSSASVGMRYLMRNCCWMAMTSRLT